MCLGNDAQAQRTSSNSRRNDAKQNGPSDRVRSFVASDRFAPFAAKLKNTTSCGGPPSHLRISLLRSSGTEEGVRLGRLLQATYRRAVEATPVFDTYWRFAAERQAVFMRRVEGASLPWSSDPIIASHRFTNAYRASDRVSQYLIRHVIYEGSQHADDVFFRILLFKFFNRIGTWELLINQLGELPAWYGFDEERYGRILDAAYARGQRLYSAAYIMPSPPFGSPRKHRNHLQLLERMMRDGTPSRVGRAKSLEEVFAILRSYPSLGAFLAFQYAIDVNYSELTDFSEMDFVVPGPGALDGIVKCFSNTSGMAESEIIGYVASIAEVEFDRLGLQFDKLGGIRPLQLIDHQNLFCEVSKYARVAHPECVGISGRTRIKQNFSPSLDPLPQFYPPKWKLNGAPLPYDGAARGSRREQISFDFVHPSD